MDAELSLPPIDAEAEIKSLRDPIRIFRNLMAEAALIDDATVSMLEREAALEVKVSVGVRGERFCHSRPRNPASECI